MIKYTHVIWDWNGTLLNDIGASLKSVNDMLFERGMSPIDADFYRECIGVPIIGFYERVFDMEKEDYNVIIKQYHEGYLKHLGGCSLTDGAIEAIDFFDKNKIKQAVVSSSNSARLNEDMIRFGVANRFDAVLGSNDFLAGSKAQRTLDYLKKSGAQSEKVLVVGDLIHDAEIAAQIGADCVLLTSGHEHISRLKSTNVKLMNNLHELIPFVENQQ